MRIEEEIIEEFEKTIVQMMGYEDGPDITPETVAYNEGVLDSFTKINNVIDNYKVDIEDGHTEVTLGWLGGTENLSFETVDEAVRALSNGYSENTAAITVPTIPVDVVFEMELSKDKGSQIWEFFDKAKESKDEKWAQWALDNSSTLASAWVANRYDLK